MIAAVDDPSTDPAHRDLLRLVEKETSLTVPSVFEGRTWGEFWAASRIGGPRLVAGEAVFIRAVADQIAAAIGRAELFARVEALAFTDPLTGLANRRVLEDALERACDRATRPGSPALALCDIDGLKAINDGYGHDAGDRVIQRVAASLSAAAAGHPDAVISRMGGDEFCVLLPSGDADTALAVCENAAAHLEPGDRRTIAISCGIAALSPELDRPAALLRSADFAQYSAKRTGPDALPAGERAHPRPSRARRDLADELLAIVRARNGAGADELLGRLRLRIERETHE